MMSSKRSSTATSSTECIHGRRPASRPPSSRAGTSRASGAISPRSGIAVLLVGAFTDLTDDLDWVGSAIGETRVQAVRLVAVPAVLEERIRRREMGSGADAQLRRTLAQVDALVDTPATHRLDTSSATVSEVATEIVALSGWRRL
jgi:hypothetical protein